MVKPDKYRAKVTGIFTYKSWFNDPLKVRQGISDQVCKDWSDVDEITLNELNRI